MKLKKFLLTLTCCGDPAEFAEESKVRQESMETDVTNLMAKLMAKENTLSAARHKFKRAINPQLAAPEPAAPLNPWLKAKSKPPPAEPAPDDASEIDENAVVEIEPPSLLERKEQLDDVVVEEFE